MFVRLHFQTNNHYKLLMEIRLKIDYSLFLKQLKFMVLIVNKRRVVSSEYIPTV